MQDLEFDFSCVIFYSRRFYLKEPLDDNRRLIARFLLDWFDLGFNFSQVLNAKLSQAFDLHCEKKFPNIELETESIFLGFQLLHYPLLKKKFKLAKV